MNRLNTFSLVDKKLQGMNAALMAGMTVWYALVLPTLPERIPVHWGPAGPNRWGSPHEMWVFLGVMLMQTAITLGAAFFIARGKERSLDGVEGATRLAARTVLDEQKKLGVRMCEWMFLGINAGMAFTWWVAVAAARTGDVSLVNHGVMALMAWMVVTILVPMIVAVRRGLSLRNKLRDILPSDDEDGWLAGGAFYVNPDDDRLWVEKRLGFGWTLNFAHRASWIILAALVGIPLLFTFLLVALAS
jgi:uncharacterized membrane protein